MSRIFDALKRAEGERRGIDGAALPEGPELLRRTERRVSSEWEGAAPSGEGERAQVIDGKKFFGPGAVHFSASAASVPAIPNAQSYEPSASLLSRFQTVSISLPRESRLVCLTDREGPPAEALRLLGVRLRDLRRTRPIKKLLITSTIPREGKTTIAANLACALAHGSEERTLLMEGDLRLPSLAKMFGLTEMPGASELLHDGRNLAECVYRLEEAGVWILPAGNAPTNPLEILQSRHLPSLLDQLSACFEWIIIDSPPVLPLADTSIWMRHADGVLLVSRLEVTEKRQLLKGLEAIESEKVLGALLNGSVASTYSSHYYRRPFRS